MISILLGVWLVPVAIGIPFIYIVEALTQRTFNPFNGWGEVAALLVIPFLWPILLPLVIGTEIYEYRLHRKARLKEISQAIEMHYKDRWYE